MILVTGIDLIEIERIQAAVTRHGRHFLERVFTEIELAEAGEAPTSLAARFAAKEAVAKALGCGIGPVHWREIEIRRDAAHRPELYLHGAAQQLSDDLGLAVWSISLSHNQTMAVAVATAIGNTL